MRAIGFGQRDHMVGGTLIGRHPFGSLAALAATAALGAAVSIGCLATSVLSRGVADVIVSLI